MNCVSPGTIKTDRLQKKKTEETDPDLRSRCCGPPRWGSRTARAAAGCRRTPERSGRGFEKTPHACSSLAASWESSSGSPGEKVQS